MTKKELEMIEALRTKLALHWTDDVLPDVAPPLSNAVHGALSKGWTYVGEHSSMMRVEPACSSTVTHSVGRVDATTTQRPIWLFSSPVLALRAMRHAVEKEAAKKLRQIDRMIDETALRELARGNQDAKAERAVTPAASEAQ